MILVIVESPAKAKTISKYLGSKYKVIASVGHVRDLPSKNDSVVPTNEFEMKWKTDPKKIKTINEINESLKKAEKLILATDPDREGEAISWHILEILKKKKTLKDKPVERVVFNAVTKDSVLSAMKAPREIDINLVEAYKTRLSLDYLVGFTLSPVLWRKLPGTKSAGRVQSVALKLICEREMEIDIFKKEEYWTIEAFLKNGKSKNYIKSILVSRNQNKLEKFDIKNKEDAENITDTLVGKDFSVHDIKNKKVKRYPKPPFTTSTLQQEASRKLGFSATRTMEIAQRLYEGVNGTEGLITYMRTDGVQIDANEVSNIRKEIENGFGKQYIPEKMNIYKTKAKNAQEAHEAIRPTVINRSPESIKIHLDSDQYKLYELIWKKTLASQMQNAEIERTTVDIEIIGNDKIKNIFRLSGQVILFDGFLSVYNENIESDEDGDEKILPIFKKDETLESKEILSTQHYTEPPARYSEASIIKNMEEIGIGRPSTYASIISKLIARNYMTIDKKRIIPESNGRLVTAFLESFFNKYVEYDFTAELEEKLDLISNGDYTRLELLNEFWNGLEADVKEIADVRITAVLDKLNDKLEPYIFPADKTNPRACPACSNGELGLRTSKNGAFVGCSNYPECKHLQPLSNKNGDEILGNKIIGIDPNTGKEVTLEKGRYGLYLEISNEDEDVKPKRASLPKNEDLDKMTIERALLLLSLPRTVGINPETGNPILAAIGKYGPYIQTNRTFASLASIDDVFTVGLNHAISLLAEKEKKGKKNEIKSLGEHPVSKSIITVMTGKYGPYIKIDKTNVTIPKNIEPELITLEEALKLIEEKKAIKKKK